MKLNIVENFGGVIGVLMILIWPYGAYHGFKNHGFAQGVLGMLVPPYAGYMAIESIWHKDNQAAGAQSVSDATKQQLWNASMDACEEIINISHHKPTGPDEIEHAKIKIHKALQLAKDFARLTETDNNESVMAFREHYVVGLQELADGFTNNDSQKLAHGIQEVNLFLDLMGKRVKK